MQDGLSKNLRSPDKGVLCPFGPLGVDYRESESRKGSGKAAFAYRFVNCNEISVINQRFPSCKLDSKLQLFSAGDGPANHFAALVLPWK